jgi:hypothetical protein
MGYLLNAGKHQPIFDHLHSLSLSSKHPSGKLWELTRMLYNMSESAFDEV